MNSPSDRHPIGVFDSGVGGLSILRHIAEMLPQEELFYFADTANCPYGAKSKDTIHGLCEGIVCFLLEQRAKIIVIACNTASAVALHFLREVFPKVPFVGMVPAVKPAIEGTRTGVIGVLATEATFQGELFADVVSRFAGGAEVLSQVCPELVEHVECGDVDSPDLEQLLRRYIEPLLSEGADTIVLGCTHYPFLVPSIRHIVGEDVRIIEPGLAMARQTARLLTRYDLATSESGAGRRIYATTGTLATFAATVVKLIDLPGEFLSARWRDDRPELIDAQE